MKHKNCFNNYTIPSGSSLLSSRALALLVLKSLLNKHVGKFFCWLASRSNCNFYAAKFQAAIFDENSTGELWPYQSNDLRVVKTQKKW